MGRSGSRGHSRWCVMYDLDVLDTDHSRPVEIDLNKYQDRAMEVPNTDKHIEATDKPRREEEKLPSSRIRPDFTPAQGPRREGL